MASAGWPTSAARPALEICIGREPAARTSSASAIGLRQMLPMHTTRTRENTARCYALFAMIALVLAATLLDLTHPFDSKTLYWPSAEGGFKLRQLHYGKAGGGYFYAANAFGAPEHGGTYLD